MAPVRLEPGALRSRVKHSTTEPLRSHKKKTKKKPVLSGLSKRRPKLVLKADYRLMQVKVLQNILQYFQPSLGYHLSLISLFCLFLGGSLRQVLLCLGFGNQRVAKTQKLTHTKKC